MKSKEIKSWVKLTGVALLSSGLLAGCLGGGGSSPAGDSSNPAGDSSNPAGDSSNPAGDSSNPAGDSSNPAGNSSNPAGDSSNPTGDSSTLTPNGGSLNFVKFSNENGDSGTDLVRDSSGNLYVLTERYDAGETGFAVIKYDAAGSLDTTYGTNGEYLFGLSNNLHEEPRGLAIDGNDNLYIAIHNDDDTEAYVQKLKPNAQPDDSFGTSGKFTYSPSHYKHIRDIAVDAQGNVYITGLSYNGISSTTANDAFVAKVTPTGVLDGSFGTGGTVMASHEDLEYASKIALDSNGNIIVAGGTSSGGGQQFKASVWKFDSNGNGDIDFGTNGRVDYLSPHLNADVYGMAVDGSNNIYISGLATNNSSQDDLLLVKFDQDGMFVNTFGNNGVVTYNDSSTPSNFVGYSVVLGSDGMVYVGGSINDNNDTFIASFDQTTGASNIQFGNAGIKTFDLKENEEDWIADLLLDSSSNELYATGRAGTPAHKAFLMKVN